MPFVELDAIPVRVLAPGFDAKLVHGDTMTLSIVDIAAGAVLPEHAHPHEQSTIMVHGELELTVGGETRVLTPGVVAVIPGGVKHSGRALTACKAIDCFHPVREDLRAPAAK